jgi:hypothetical protein
MQATIISKWFTWCSSGAFKVDPPPSLTAAPRARARRSCPTTRICPEPRRAAAPSASFSPVLERDGGRRGHQNRHDAPNPGSVVSSSSLAGTCGGGGQIQHGFHGELRHAAVSSWWTADEATGSFSDGDLRALTGFQAR